MRTGPLRANRVGDTPEAAARRQGTARAIARPACRRTARRRPTRTRDIVIPIPVAGCLHEPGRASGPTRVRRVEPGRLGRRFGPALLRLPAEGGDQLILGHGRAALDLQLPSPLAQLLDAALLIGASVGPAVLPGRLGLRCGRVICGGLRLLDALPA